mmetsp:Transcript_111265/g.314044  ORF Transcript_111265/g.314044 Transcript_111265/m.314044 type:complete len:759 (-) Transcript_111265:424-2700(-)
MTTPAPRVVVSPAVGVPKGNNANGAAGGDAPRAVAELQGVGADAVRAGTAVHVARPATVRTGSAATNVIGAVARGDATSLIGTTTGAVCACAICAGASTDCAAARTANAAGSGVGSCIGDLGVAAQSEGTMMARCAAPGVVGAAAVAAAAGIVAAAKSDGTAVPGFEDNLKGTAGASCDVAGHVETMAAATGFKGAPAGVVDDTARECGNAAPTQVAKPSNARGVDAAEGDLVAVTTMLDGAAAIGDVAAVISMLEGDATDGDVSAVTAMLDGWASEGSSAAGPRTSPIVVRAGKHGCVDGDPNAAATSWRRSASRTLGGPRGNGNAAARCSLTRATGVVANSARSTVSAIATPEPVPFDAGLVDTGKDVGVTPSICGLPQRLNCPFNAAICASRTPKIARRRAFSSVLEAGESKPPLLACTDSGDSDRDAGTESAETNATSSARLAAPTSPAAPPSASTGAEALFHRNGTVGAPTETGDKAHTKGLRTSTTCPSSTGPASPPSGAAVSCEEFDDAAASIVVGSSASDGHGLRWSATLAEASGRNFPFQEGDSTPASAPWSCRGAAASKSNASRECDDAVVSGEVDVRREGTAGDDGGSNVEASCPSSPQGQGPSTSELVSSQKGFGTSSATPLESTGSATPLGTSTGGGGVIVLAARSSEGDAGKCPQAGGASSTKSGGGGSAGRMLVRNMRGHGKSGPSAPKGSSMSVSMSQPLSHKGRLGRDDEGVSSAQRPSTSESNARDVSISESSQRSWCLP